MAEVPASDASEMGLTRCRTRELVRTRPGAIHTAKAPESQAFVTVFARDRPAIESRGTPRLWPRIDFRHRRAQALSTLRRIVAIVGIIAMCATGSGLLGYVHLQERLRE